MFKAAFYKSRSKGVKGVYNVLVQFFTKSKYSHVEMVFSDGLCGSASFLDHGVRLKHIEFDESKWDFVLLPQYLEIPSRLWFEKHKGEKYDTFGVSHFIFNAISPNKNKWFCSEAAAKSLGFQRAWNISPGDFHSILTFILENHNKTCKNCFFE